MERYIKLKKNIERTSRHMENTEGFRRPGENKRKPSNHMEKLERCREGPKKNTERTAQRHGER